LEVSYLVSQQVAMAAGATRQPDAFSALKESELLHEQLDYLIQHATQCSSGCSDCLRFHSVREALMRVWR
jgi:hypothetical protein